jgi:hypothetical protein
MMGLKAALHQSSRMTLARALMCGSMFGVILCGQSLRVPASHTDRKTPGEFSAIIDSPPGKAPIALQWDLSVPPAVAIRASDITIGKEAKSARKSLTCVSKPVGKGARYSCILAGGQEPIGNGPIVVVQYRAQADVQTAPIRVAMENILGVSADLKRVPIPNVDAIINIFQ